MSHCSNLYRNNNNNNNYSFVILICLQPFYKQHLHLIVRFIYRRILNQTQLHTRLTQLLLTCCLLCLALLYANTFSLQNILKVEGSHSHHLEKSIATACICAFLYLPVLFSLMLVVIGLLGSCSMYLLVCTCYVFAYV